MADDERRNSAQSQLAEYRQRMSMRQSPASAARGSQPAQPPPASNQVEHSAFVDEPAPDKEMTSPMGAQAQQQQQQQMPQVAQQVPASAAQNSGQPQSEYERMIEAQMRMFPEGFDEPELVQPELPQPSINNSNDTAMMQSNEVPMRQEHQPLQPQPYHQEQLIQPGMGPSLSPEQAFLMEQQLAFAAYEQQNAARQGRAGQIPPNQQNFAMGVGQGPQPLQQSYPAYPGGPEEQWPQSRRSSMRSSQDSDAEGNIEQPRDRDLAKKMKVPFFGMVYKRQMMINAISAVLIGSYITLLCLV